ncbi:unnamed protein product [Periconia digitata]|uniref:Uncharacterized protein n=1 Tax=Periconia digitata TaxID=1303443 RepID=A0A9W4XHU4_9PLEO|nr:unnamed protein product [Periconia digitata]
MDFTNATDWFPSNISLLKYDNVPCANITPWTSAWLVSDKGGFNYPITAEIVRIGIRKYWNDQRNASTPPLLEIFSWFFEQEDTLKGQMTIQMLEISSSEHCRKDLCSKLRWMGVSDLAGRGMLATYFIQCIMVTAYFAIHTASRCGWKPRRRTKSGWLLAAVQESLRPFLDATLLFSIALNVAAIVTLSRSYYGESETVTMIMSSVYIALYGVFPSIVLHSCAAPHMRRRIERRLMWVFIAILVLVMCIMFFSMLKSELDTSFTDLPRGLREISGWDGTYDDNTKFNNNNNNNDLKKLLVDDKDDQLKWESLCLNQRGVLIGFRAILGLASFLVASGFLSLTFVTNIFRIPQLRSERSRFLRKIRQHWWMISAVVSIVIMWAIVIVFCVLRDRLNDNTGDSNEDKKWTFGQILAVATWAPVLMEALIIWKQGPEKGLSGLMSDRFEVFEVADLGGQRVIKSQVHLPPSDGMEDGYGLPEISVISPLTSRHGSLSDSTAMETPGVDEMRAEPMGADSESNEKRQNA